MTLEEAVAVLNRERHDRWDGWHIVEEKAPPRFEGVEERYVVGQYRCEQCLTPFEAVAIAEKYERDPD